MNTHFDSNQTLTLADIVARAKQRGFVYQGSELYGGISGVFDYGPLGSILKHNIKNSWIRKFVSQRTDTFLMDSSILMSHRVWEATGHVEHFNDPLVDDLKTGKRYRADHLLEENGINPEGMTTQQMTDEFVRHSIKSPEGNPLSPVRQFNMMLKTHVGPAEDSSSLSYLRPETAQGMFVNFKNVVDSLHPSLPFGMAQVGKAFRNEITPKNFLFRLRELEQMEIEYFVHHESWQELFVYWRDEMLEWVKEIGIDLSRVHEREIPEQDRAHYSQRTIDIEFEFPFGTKELLGLAYRGDYDLNKHAQYSGVPLYHIDPHTHEKYVPHVIEPTFGLDRVFFALLVSAYKIDQEGRCYLDLPPNIAPYTVCVSPLVKNKPDIVEKAREVFARTKQVFHNVVLDMDGNIGKRYKKQDEIGTPFCVVVDYDSLQDNMVTVRHRNTTHQERIACDDLVSFITRHIVGE